MAKDNADKHRKAYGAATTRLRDENRERFNVLMKEEAEKVGLDWKPRATAEEKAAEQVLRLLAEHPSLAAQLGVQEAGPTQEFGGADPSLVDEDAPPATPRA